MDGEGVEYEGAVQVIGLNEKLNKLVYNPKQLTHVLSQLPRPDMKLCVVSVVGAFRTGKSFLLDLLLRFLRFKGTLTGADDISWLMAEGGNLEGNEESKAPDFVKKGSEGPRAGFKWRAGNKRMTVGMWLWSEPFVRRLKSGEEVAVLLMDTQGLFDTVTNQTLTAHIFGLSTLFSSYQVYNIKERVGEDALQNVALFSEYARIASGVAEETESDGKVGEGENATLPRAVIPTPSAAMRTPVSSCRELDRGHSRPTPVFQRLEFLIRDFQLSSPALWNDAGGAELEMGRYFAELFDVEGERSATGNKALRETREHILDCFKNVSCFGLPHPGDDVAGNAETPYDGSVAKIRDRFRLALSRYAHAVFNDQLEPKRVAAGGVSAGLEVTAEEFPHYVESYAKVFERSATDKRFPEAVVLLEATASASNRSARDHALNHYQKACAALTKHFTMYVEPSSLELQFRDLISEALGVFDKRAQFGSRQMRESSRTSLKSDLEEVMVDGLERNKKVSPPLAEWMILLVLWFCLVIIQSCVDFTCSSWLSLCFNLSRLAALLKTLIILLIPWSIFMGKLPPLVSAVLRELGSSMNSGTLPASVQTLLQFSGGGALNFPPRGPTNPVAAVIDASTTSAPAKASSAPITTQSRPSQSHPHVERRDPPPPSFPAASSPVSSAAEDIHTTLNSNPELSSSNMPSSPSVTYSSGAVRRKIRRD